MKSPSTDGMTSSQKRRASAEMEKHDVYVSPVKRVKTAVSTKSQKRTYESADELKSFLRTGDTQFSSSSVMIKARVVWTSFETVRTGPVARIHLIDMRASDSLEEMHNELRDKYDANKVQIDQELITASVYGVDKNTKGIPKDGKIVLINSVWSLKLFLNQSCQFTTSLECIKTVPEALLFP